MYHGTALYVRTDTRLASLWLAALALAACCPPAGRCAEEKADAGKTAVPPTVFKREEAPVPAPGGPVVAVTSFTVSADSAELNKLGEEIRILLEQKLAEAGLTIVDRARLAEAMREAQMSLAGMTDPAAAKQLGKMLGADFVVAGRLSELAGTLLVSGKAVDTETTRVVPVGVEIQGKEKLVAAVSEAAAALAGKLRAARNAPAAAGKAEAALPEGSRPRVMALFSEMHLTRVVLDPASETAAVRYLLRHGFQVVDPAFAKQLRSNEKTLAELKANKDNLARLGKEHQANVILLGEAFSEAATGMAGMTSCRARVEAKAIHAATGLLLAYDSEQAGASDIAELAAGKRAIESATEQLMPRLAAAIIRRWQQPEKTPAPEGGK
jgi:TolB-like protein